MELTAAEVDALLQRFAVTPWSTGDVDALDAVVADGYVLHPDSTIEDLKEAVRSVRQGLPDLKVTIEETITQADKIAYRWTMRGTHQGEMDGIAPTGKSVTVSGITILRVQDGKVIEDGYESSSPDSSTVAGLPARRETLEAPACGRTSLADPPRRPTQVEPSRWRARSNAVSSGHQRGPIQPQRPNEHLM